MAHRPTRLIALVGIYLLIAHVLPAPAGVDPQGWRITGIFFATIAGLMLQPMPGSQVVLLGLTMLVLVGRVPMERALTGYSAASVWMVLAVMLMSRALTRLRSCPPDRALVRACHRSDVARSGLRAASH